MSSRVLIVDDETNVLAALQRVLRRDESLAAAGLLIETFNSAERALLRAREASFDLVLSDYRMPGMDGLAFLLAFRELQPDAARLILSGMTDFDVLMVAINEVGISRFLPKPWADDELAAAVAEGIAATQARREQSRLADAKRAERDPVYREALARRTLAESEPGILHVDWGPNGEVLLEDPDIGPDRKH